MSCDNFKWPNVYVLPVPKGGTEVVGSLQYVPPTMVLDS